MEDIATCNVEVFWKPTCPFCIKAVDFLRKKGAQRITCYDVTKDNNMRMRLSEKLRNQWNQLVPQIFIDGRHIGGWDNLQTEATKWK